MYGLCSVIKTLNRFYANSIMTTLTRPLLATVNKKTQATDGLGLPQFESVVSIK